MFIIATLLSSYSFLTVKQNNYWKDAVSFYERTLKYVPDSLRMLSNLGNLYEERGRKEEAIAVYKKAIEIHPYSPYAYNNLGALYYDAGDIGKAASLFKKAVEIEPDYRVAQENLKEALK